MEALLIKETAVFPEKAAKRMMLDREAVLRNRKRCRRLRRIQDVLLSGLALLILWPFMLAIAALIYIDSPGASPIFVQDRVGENGRVFKFYKFRSMIPNAEEELNALLQQNEMEGPVFKMKDDPRITRMGKFIRRTSIDELPQLWNVLKGDMSIVGPRPPLPREVEQYDAYQRQRLLVTPGLTCYWQIQRNRYDLSFDEWLELDIRYIEENSFKNDWIVIWKTVGTILRMDGE